MTISMRFYANPEPRGQFRRSFNEDLCQKISVLQVADEVMRSLRNRQMEDISI